MLKIGLTGPSGAGKGEVCSLFAKLGVPSIDTDRVYREIAVKGSPCLDELVSFFSKDVLKEDGSLDRKKLALAVFSDREKLAALNSITHKYILKETEKRLEKLEKDGYKAAIVDAPVLFESGWDKNCDVVISVVANKDTRVKRIRLRDGITEKAALQRLNSMHNSSFYVSKSDIVIKNDSTPRELEKKVKEAYSRLFPLS